MDGEEQKKEGAPTKVAKRRPYCLKAGPRIEVARTITIRVSAEIADIYEAQPHKSRFVSDAIRYYAASLERKAKKASKD